MASAVLADLGSSNVSNPATPSLANSGPADDIFVSGNYAYIAEGGGTKNAFEIFDISRVPAAR